MKSTTTQLQLSVATALALTLAMPAYARTAATSAQAEDGGSTGDIIVTARRVEERLQDVPVSVTVFNQQQLTERNISNATDLARVTPSLSSNSRFGTENATFGIRGFTQELGTAPSVGVYFADVVAPRAASTGFPAGNGAGPGSFFDLQNVQVLSGPQGTLFGRNTTGGAVLLVPQKPTAKFEGYVEGSYGNYDMKRIQAVVNIPLADTLRFRVGGDFQDRDGYQRNRSGIGPARRADVHYIALRGSLVWDVTDNLENYTIFSYSDSKTKGSTMKDIACRPTGTTLGAANCAQLQLQTNLGFGFYDVMDITPNPESRNTQWQVINTTTWKANDNLTLKNIVSYARLKNKLRGELYGSYWNSADLVAQGSANTGLIYGPAVVNPLPGGHSAAQTTFTEELQAQGQALDGNLQYTAGVYFESSKPIEPIGSQSPNLMSCVDPNVPASCSGGRLGASSLNYTSGEFTYRSVGIYGQTSYNLTSKLKLNAGLRYTWDYVKNVNQRYVLLYPGAGPLAGQLNAQGQLCTNNQLIRTTCQEMLTQKSDAPTWVLGFDWKPADNVLLYTKWSRGYRTGGVVPNAPFQFKTYQPEKLNTYEIGAKTDWRGAIPGHFNVSAFYNNFKNQQIQLGFTPLSVFPGTTAVVNVGASRIQGLEIDAGIRPFQGFSLNVNYTMLDTKVKKNEQTPQNDPAYRNQNYLVIGDELPFSPGNKYTVSAAYTLPLDESIGKITLGASYSHTDAYITNYANRRGVADTEAPAFTSANLLSYVKGYNLLSLNLNWNSVLGAPVDLSLFGTNVQNNKYLTVLPGQATSGFEFANTGEPRMYGVRLKYRFGQ